MDDTYMKSLFSTLRLSRGPALRNRFVLAPLTNCQSHEDGTLSDDEFRWLTMRAQGGFALTMTCAAHVSAHGQGFPGQLGIYSDEHLPGLARLASGIKAAGSLAITQLHHAGMRSPKDLIKDQPVCPSDNEETGAREMSAAEVQQVTADFIAAAARAERVGFDGVEIHGAHGYLICQFLSAEINKRTDGHGGSLENRSRLLFEIVDGVRAHCGRDFIVGVRLSPERFGMKLDEARRVAQRLMQEARIDFLDMSLWDVFKEPEEEEFRGRSLLSYFTDLDRGGVMLGAAGKIMGGPDALRCLEAGVDFLVIGRAAILHHDFPEKVAGDPQFHAIATPVSVDYLKSEGLGPALIEYMRRWKGFVA
jgi:2,4-dienoyl-CoA reductase-like NADH-dependent reductase (Old Yellow Enzyme family)